MTQTSLSANSDSFNFSALVKDVKVALIIGTLAKNMLRTASNPYIV
ncbi:MULTISPECIES: hypothetical protein [Okeania]|nr:MULTISPECIES: hypothetical protein [Okeania]NET15051.1 hypothetical protein [Okeania sp. SIO1H6]NES76528.1 hypothetical protein [Okeania sp. SIO1H4]NES90427.1 hypothetical protein [Okeania sp. SIO2B9]NET20394.1 hypothetical protein [Okeania sp. SIO1H5]NET77016.1 hypothetical protein [Okeania sp. SIO1F9]